MRMTDGYLICLFAIVFTKCHPNQVCKTTYAQTSQIREIRKKIIHLQLIHAGTQPNWGVNIGDSIQVVGLRDLLIITDETLIQFSRARPIQQTFFLVRLWDHHLLGLPDFSEQLAFANEGEIIEDWSESQSGLDNTDKSFSNSPGEEELSIDSDVHLQSLCLMVHLGQAFSALLVVQQHVGEYKRVTLQCRDALLRADFKQQCSTLCAANRDTSFTASDHDKAIDLYSMVIDLDSASNIFFASCSEAKSSKMLWENALLDTRKVTKLNPLSHVGYQLSHSALHGLHNHVDQVGQLLLKLIYEICVSRILCNRAPQINSFKTSSEYKELFMSVIQHLVCYTCGTKIDVKWSGNGHGAGGKWIQIVNSHQL
ncbi:uncharacterized protein F5891DRAFT_986891 [Suillus fuscotomentosus]|uniref:Uncharacterized protein n=1 Tax=Suillus fuscotomentosus TaxID=1912939 RepID=A0AAD4HDN2_9AGAM|nr:uncharacterized protein F5891DRAFT_986891 [Suillus fuscotomentosus]KAG1890641.1 hypothetical protein F5891DRAFT_986891 [Suillus fuscotomentosus]